MVARKSKRDEYPDDIFADTRMSFGEHLDELRTRMIRGLMWLGLFVVIGFILDGIGESVGNKNIGIGRPMLTVITDPVESQVRDFYYRRNLKSETEKLTGMTNSDPEEIRKIRKKLLDNGNSLTVLDSDERRLLLGAPQEMPVVIPTKSLEPIYGPAKADAPPEVAIKMQVYPAYISSFSTQGETLLESRQYLSTLSVQEGFVVYFKVSIICGIVLSSPMLLYQFWAFVGAGLYPHEKKYVYAMFWPSLILFLSGVLLCQFFVLPGAIKALLKFNEFLGFDPDIRLREYLGLALILPLVFGLSFQTPLVMIFLNRIGIFSAADYMKRWRQACFVLAFLSALLTPTPDIITMLYMFVPMFGLYLVGIAFCHYFPGSAMSEEELAPEEVAV